MSTPAELIKERLPVEEVIGSYIALQRAGRNFKAKCPFHGEKTPSFFVSPERQSFYCFGCSANGDIFSFVERFEGLDFKGALKLLASRAGIELQNTPQKNDDSDRLRVVIDKAVEHFKKNLQSNSDAIQYLKNRGVTEKMIAEWNIGFAKDTWRDLYDSLITSGFSDVELRRAGLIKEADKEGKIVRYDIFRGRIMFPIADSSGRVVAFTGRIFPDKDGVGKYVNSPETEVFRKSKILFGYDRAKFAMRDRGFALVVEGQMDLIHAQNAGFTNSVAVSGTAFTSDQLALIKRFTDTIVFCFDGDSAGLKAAKRSSALALPRGFNVKIANLPEGDDPASLIIKDKTLFENSIKNAKHVIEFLLDMALLHAKGPRDIGRAIKEDVLPFIQTLESAVEASRFVTFVSARAGIPEDAVRKDLVSVKPFEDSDVGVSESSTPKTGSSPEYSSSLIRQASALHLLIRERDGLEKADKFWKSLEPFLPKDEATLWHAPPDEMAKSLLLEAEIFFGERLDESAGALLERITEEYLRREFMITMTNLKKAEAEKDTDNAKILLARCHELSNQLAILKKKG